MHVEIKVGEEVIPLTPDEAAALLAGLVVAAKVSGVAYDPFDKKSRSAMDNLLSVTEKLLDAAERQEQKDEKKKESTTTGYSGVGCGPSGSIGCGV